jgi:hypothetical protein
MTRNNITLQIAERVEKIGFGECADAAIELRRLHEVNAELVEALRFCFGWVKAYGEPESRDMICAVLAKAEEK